MSNAIMLPDAIRQRKPHPEDMEVWEDVGYKLGYVQLRTGNGRYFAWGVDNEFEFLPVTFIPDRLTLPNGV